MSLRKTTFLIPIIIGALVLASLIFLLPARPASAQCGSQASSCKNCHEVQAQDPVNNDGTGWHTGHAFGDFCYICHAGNNQSMVADDAHAGMVPPLSDVNAACMQCHPGDLMERAQIYATALGVEIGTGGAPGAGTGGTQPSPATEGTEVQPASEPVVSADTTVIDYDRRYAEQVLGQRTINWGNIIVGAMIAMIALGGGGFAYYNERKLRGLPFLPAALTPSQPAETPLAIPQIEGYSPEVLALLPRIARLNPVGLHALQRLLENPEEASALLHSLSRLDPELVRRIRTLDRESRALLLALSGD